MSRRHVFSCKFHTLLTKSPNICFHSPLRDDYLLGSYVLHMGNIGTSPREAVNVFGRFIRERARRPALHREGIYVCLSRENADGGRCNFHQQCADRELVFYLCCCKSLSCSESYIRTRYVFELVLPLQSAHDLHARSNISVLMSSTLDSCRLLATDTRRYRPGLQHFIQQYQCHMMFGMCVA